MRIVSLLPSATEIVCALGYGDQLVGRSHECDHPASVTELPVCSRARIRVDTSSREIDRSVKAIVAEGLSVYEIDEETLRTLAPDFIVTQTQCEVCAVSERDVVQAVRDWLGGQSAIISLNPNRLQDVWTDIIRVASALGNRRIGEDVVAALCERMSEIHERTAKRERKPRVALIEWIEPLMAAGNWMPELVDMAGGRNLFGEAGERSPWMELDALRESDPDVVVVAPCGFDLERTRSEMQPLTDRPEWNALTAVGKGQVYLTDGHHFFNRPGPRLVESVEILAELLHPDSIASRHRGQAWMPL
ncbi:MAG: cobalamin-binding protein [Gammaproteobacteria bacterium]|nr:MAG: cobalamin-binding protein [Gammaproteobacteria bacterium]